MCTIVCSFPNQFEVELFFFSLYHYHVRRKQEWSTPETQTAAPKAQSVKKLRVPGFMLYFMSVYLRVDEYV